MRILLIKPKQIGDSLILTPTIVALKRAHPDAEIWVVVRRGCEGILAGCPEIARVVTVAPVEKRDRRAGDLWNDLRTLWLVFTHRFDFVFELGDGSRGRTLARLAQSQQKFSVKPSDPWAKLGAEKAGCKISTFDWETCHRVEKDFRTVSEFLPLPEPLPPLRFDPARAQAWAPGASLTEFGVVQVGSRQGFNRWHRDGWLAVGRALLEKFPNVVVACGPVANEQEEAVWLTQELGPRALNTAGMATWPEMAWLLARARLYVGPNTAAMHLAAACGCPVVALFGPSIEDYWHPWQVPYRIVTTPGYVPPADTAERYALIKKRAMSDIDPLDVIEACDALMADSKTPPSAQSRPRAE